MEKIIKRSLTLNHIDPLMGRFHIDAVMNKAGDADKDIRSKRELVLQRSCFPDVYEPTEDLVIAEMVIKVSFIKGGKLKKKAAATA